MPTRATLIAIAVFIAKWAVAGLAFAGVLLWLRPELMTQSTSIANANPGTEVEQRKIPVLTQAPAVTPSEQSPPPVPTTMPAAPTAATLVVSYADAVARASPAVVSIYTARVVDERIRPQALDRLLGLPPQAPRPRVEGSLGAGVIINTQGHVVTNNHVIASAQEIRLQLADGRIAPAKVVGNDIDSDLAVLKIDLPRLPAMPMGRSDRLRVGDVVLAIGNPFGLSQTVTQGIISAKGRNQLNLTQFESYIQTDAAVNIGNSGGALITAHGDLIGVITARQSGGSEGINFAIPVELVLGVVDQIIKQGRVIRGWLGVQSQSLTPRRAAELQIKPGTGVEIVEVYENSPAAAAGLRPGDIITALNGTAVRDERDAQSRVAASKPGSKLRIQGKNPRGDFDVSVTVVERAP